MKRASIFTSGIFALLALCAPVIAGDSSINITIPKEVGQALEDVGVHIDSEGDKSGITKAALIGGGIVAAGIIIAVALRKKK